MEQIKWEQEIQLVPKGQESSYQISPLKGDTTISITTTLSRPCDRIIIFTSNLGGPKLMKFDVGCDIKEFPVDRTGYYEIIFNGDNFVERFSGNLKGEKGDQGKQGQPGESIKGEKGDSIVGPTGPMGLPGKDSTVPGPKGDKGDSIKGDSIVGPTGPMGLPGLDGRDGKNGRSCTCDHCKENR